MQVLETNATYGTYIYIAGTDSPTLRTDTESRLIFSKNCTRSTVCKSRLLTKYKKYGLS
jgi:hypothetical protein